MQKTTIQVAMKKLQARHKLLTKEYEDSRSPKTLGRVDEIATTLLTLQSLLPDEQKIIEDSFNAGSKAERDWSNGKFVMPSASDYYLTTFTAPDGDKSKEK